jgi:hypothetical protein
MIIRRAAGKRRLYGNVSGKVKASFGIKNVAGKNHAD